MSKIKTILLSRTIRFNITMSLSTFVAKRLISKFTIMTNFFDV